MKAPIKSINEIHEPASVALKTVAKSFASDENVKYSIKKNSVQNTFLTQLAGKKKYIVQQ